MNKLTTTFLVIVSMIAAIGTLPYGFAWEERLAECKALGVLPENCPENGPIIVPKPVSTESSSDGSYCGKSTKYLWVVDKVISVDANQLCFQAHKRIKMYHSRLTESVDEKDVTMVSCIKQHQRVFDLLKE